MKVKTCNACPYTPEDLAHNYDPSATTYCCGRCPQSGLVDTSTGPYYREWVKYPERTNYFKRHGGQHGEDSPPMRV